MDKLIAGGSTEIQTRSLRYFTESARNVLIAFVAGLLAMVVASAAFNWDTVTQPVVQQNG